MKNNNIKIFHCLIIINLIFKKLILSVKIKAMQTN